MAKKAYVSNLSVFFWLFFFLTVSCYGGVAKSTLKVLPKNPKESIEQSRDFKQIVSFCEKKYNIPPKLLVAIAKVESEYSPFAINAEGRAKFFLNQASALKYIKSLRQRGVRNINVGYMQINLASHGKKFKNLEETINPYHNIQYAARLIATLYRFHGCWERAIGFYHSSSLKHRLHYKNKVLKTWEKITAKPAVILIGKSNKI